LEEEKINDGDFHALSLSPLHLPFHPANKINVFLGNKLRAEEKEEEEEEEEEEMSRCESCQLIVLRLLHCNRGKQAGRVAR
jgi:hypothetical protein